MTTEPFHYVFVYGSLKQGYWNNRIIARSLSNRFLGPCTTSNASFELRSLGAYPGVFKGGSHAIRGELFSVDHETFNSLDRLEGNGSFYTREKVGIQERSDIRPWIYILPECWRDNSCDDDGTVISVSENTVQWDRENYEGLP